MKRRMGEEEKVERGWVKERKEEEKDEIGRKG